MNKTTMPTSTYASNSRPCAGLDDLPLFSDLQARIRPPERSGDFPGRQDLFELLSLPAVAGDTRLWLAESGRLAAYAIVDGYNNLVFEFDPQAFPQEQLAELVAWGDDCLRRRPDTDANTTLDASCRAEDSARLALLESFGFQPQTVRSILLRRSLHEPIPAPRLPEGFYIRAVDPHGEADAWVTLCRAAFGTDHMTVEERLAMVSGPHYDPEIDLVAVAPDGRLAAFCMCSIDPQENACTGRKDGYTDPVATDPAYQRRGLARALLLHGMQLLRQRGMDYALMGTSSENPGMLAAAHATGFRDYDTKVWFSRPLGQ